MEIKINKAKEVHNNKYDYSKVKFEKMIEKVIIICPDHGEFIQTMHKHLQGDGCRKCGTLKRATSKINEAKKTFIEKAFNIHKNLYDYSLVEYRNAKTNIKIICKIHGEFEITPNKHLSGGGCQKCGRQIISKKLMYPLNKYLEEVNEIYDNKYDYSKVKWEGTDKKIIIICPEHNIEFTTLAKDHRDKRIECRECKIYKPIYNQLTNEEFINKSKLIWGDKYDYSKTNYINMNQKVIIICKIHGEFLQYPSNHYRYNCLRCSATLKNLPKLTLAKESFIDKANKIHNFKYTYEKSLYINAFTKLIVTCNKHGDFEVTPNNHLRERGCFKCKNKGYSKVSLEWLKFCEVKYNCKIQNAITIEGEYNIPNTSLRVDGYCAKTNTIFEFYGDFYHGNPEVFDPKDWNPISEKIYDDLYHKTLNREKYLTSLNYNIISIWENDWEKFKKLIKKIQKRFKKNILQNIKILNEKKGT